MHVSIVQYFVPQRYKVQLQIIVCLLRQLQHYLYSSNHLVKLLIQILTLIIQLLLSEKQLFLMHGNFLHLHAMKLHLYAAKSNNMYEPIHLNFVTAYELPLFGDFINSVK